MSAEDRLMQTAIASRAPASSSALRLALMTVQRLAAAGQSRGQAVHSAAAAHFVPAQALADAYGRLLAHQERRARPVTPPPQPAPLSRLERAERALRRGARRG